MNSAPGYLIDSDVLITAKNSYYAFTICPGFWKSLLHGHSHGHLHSIDRVKQELLRGDRGEDLVQWVHQSVPKSFFVKSNVQDVVVAFTEVMGWATRHSRYRDEAKTKFASGADGWLVAHGMATGKTVITNEESSPKSLNKIKLPDACHAFSVHCDNTFSMLHRLGAQYHWSP